MNRSRFIPFITIIFLSVIVYAQEHKSGRTTIHIEHADSMEGSERYGKNVQVLFGNVRFRHHNTVMHCDSAFFHREQNSMDAYGSIHIIQDDSIHLYGNILHYEGNQDLAMVRENVRLINNDVILRTEFLDYNRRDDVAYYFNGGLIESGENELKSDYGYYYPRIEEAHFQENVVVTNPEYIISSDTMVYYTIPEVVKITGPTTIESERNIIYSEAGFYDTKNNQSRLEKNSRIIGEEQLLTGDTIFYDRDSGFGEVFSNMAMHDTTNHVIISGDYGYYNELTKKALATRRAVLMQIHNQDTLFLHADTLRADPIPDSEYQLIRAYRNVKFFRPDFQGRCDSMVYDLRDSINSFYINPILWAQGNQLTAEIIRLYTRNRALYKTELIQRAFVIAPEDTSGYNQIKGNNMLGYINNNQLYRIDVDGSGQTIYYPKEDGYIIGMNKAEASNLTILLEDHEVTGIILRTQPSGNLNPPLLISPDASLLSGFRWLEDYQPKNKEDIFIHDSTPEPEDRINYDEFMFDRPVPSR